MEVYHEQDRAKRATKDMAGRCKLAWQQAKTTTELWQALEHRPAEPGERLQINVKTALLASPPPNSNPQDATPRTNPISPRTQMTVSTSTNDDSSTTIHKHEEDLAMYTTMVDKAKELYKQAKAETV